MTLHSITATYPGFQALPKGIKQMLLVSESVFFEEARAPMKTKQVTQQQVLPESHPVPPEVWDFIPTDGGQTPHVRLRVR